MDSTSLEGGFANPPVEAAEAFRAVLEAMARPGRIETLRGATPPAPVSVAAGAVLLTLCDAETPLYIAGAADCPEVWQWVSFHTGAPKSSAGEAMFALGTWDDLLPLDQYSIGRADYPDRSATLIVEMPELVARGATLTGPGIKDTASLSVPDVAAFQANRAMFPLGLDFVLTCEDRIAGLPRSTRVSTLEEAV